MRATEAVAPDARTPITFDIRTPYGFYSSCRVTAAHFAVGGQVRLDATDQAGEPIARITTNLLGADVNPEEELVIKNRGENEGPVDCLVAAKLVKPPHRNITQGYVTFKVCRPVGPLKALIAALPPVPEAKKANAGSRKRATQVAACRN